MSNGQRRAEGKKARTSRLVPILVFFRSTLSDFFPPLFFCLSVKQPFDFHLA